MAWFKKEKYTTLKRAKQKTKVPPGLVVRCPACMERVLKKTWDDALHVCLHCGHHDRLGAWERIEQLLDAGSFEEHDGSLGSGDPLEFRDTKPYSARLEAACEATGLNEGVVCGIGAVEGRRISISVMDVNFIGGSMGSVVGEKIARSIERGIELGLPVLIVCGSGGARMQEGILSLMQMAKTSACAARLAEAGLPLVTLLTDPTTGGVTASFAMLGDVIIAEPNALIGFAGPKVIEGTIKQILPAGFQRSEFMSEHGFVDIVSRRADLRPTLTNIFSILMHAREAAPRSAAPKPSTGKLALDATPSRV